MTRLVVAATSPYQVALFLEPHLALLDASVSIEVFTNLDDPYASLLGDLPVTHVPFRRTPLLTPSDLAAFLRLVDHLRGGEVRVVESISPKAGFLAQAAARVTGVPRRLHLFTGQAWSALPSHSPLRLAARTADRCIAAWSTHLLADSNSQADFLHDEGIVATRTDIEVPGHGSIRGVDPSRFHPDRGWRTATRRAMGTSSEALVFLLLGRIATAKGIDELVAAHGRLRRRWTDGGLAVEPVLWVVGPDEGGHAARLERLDGIVVGPFTAEPEHVTAAADVLVLPSHREGFGSAVIEAAASGIPTIGSRIPGIVDAVEPGRTGWLVPVRRPDLLHEAMAEVASNPQLAVTRGRAARRRALQDFDADVVTEHYAEHVRRLLELP